jgi:hypothetical protein
VPDGIGQLAVAVKTKDNLIGKARTLHGINGQTPAMTRLLEDLRKLAKPCLSLKPTQNSDQVRWYLKKHGLRLVTARAVLENLRLFLMVQNAFIFLDRRGIPCPNSKTMTQREWDAEVIGLAEARPGGESKEGYLQRVLPSGKESYEIPQVWLDEMIAWKRSRKSTGGKRGAGKLSERALQSRSTSGKFLSKKSKDNP